MEVARRDNNLKERHSGYIVSIKKSILENTFEFGERDARARIPINHELKKAERLAAIEASDVDKAYRVDSCAKSTFQMAVISSRRM